MLNIRQWYSTGPGNDVIVKERFEVRHRGDLYLAWRATEPGPGYAILHVTARQRGVNVWQETYLGWFDEFYRPPYGQFAPHTVDRVRFLQIDTTSEDAWARKPAADPIGPDVRTVIVRWPDNECDIMHLYPIRLPQHDVLIYEVEVQMAGDNGKVRVVLATIVDGLIRYQY